MYRPSLWQADRSGARVALAACRTSSLRDAREVPGDFRKELNTACERRRDRPQRGHPQLVIPDTFLAEKRDRALAVEKALTSARNWEDHGAPENEVAKGEAAGSMRISGVKGGDGRA